MKRLLAVVMVCAVSVTGCSTWNSLRGEKLKPVPVAPVSKIRYASNGVQLTDSDGAPIETVEFRAGISSATVEKMAKLHGCSGGVGAGLMSEPGPVEVYRMRCEDGRVFTARCELRQCTALPGQPAPAAVPLNPTAGAGNDGAASAAPAYTRARVAADSGGPLASHRVRKLGGICLFTGIPPAELTYTAVKEFDYEKGTYGSVNDILPIVVADAKAAGADAIIHYNGAQHFAVWPWRFVRPVINGTAIKWSPARDVDCESAGGYYTTGTLAEAPPPPPTK